MNYDVSRTSLQVPRNGSSAPYPRQSAHLNLLRAESQDGQHTVAKHRASASTTESALVPSADYENLDNDGLQSCLHSLSMTAAYVRSSVTKSLNKISSHGYIDREEVHGERGTHKSFFICKTGRRARWTSATRLSRMSSYCDLAGGGLSIAFFAR